jgi:hypothetical protein
VGPRGDVSRRRRKGEEGPRRSRPFGSKRPPPA